MTDAGRRRVVLCVAGSVAIVKAGSLITGLRRRQVEVRVAMTAGAQRLVTPLLLQSLSGHPVLTSTFEGHEDNGMDHLTLGGWAQLLLVAPASASVIARLAHGLADDAVTTVALASAAPLLLAPAMEPAMWSHPATRANIALLVERGARLAGPVEGRLASGREGLGRMAEVDDILTAVEAVFSAGG